MKTYTWLLISLVCLALQSIVPVEPAWAGLIGNTQIINQARVFYFDGIATKTAMATVTVTAVVRTPSTVEYLTYAPLLPGAVALHVSPTSYRTGGAASDPFAVMPAPTPAGSTAPVDLSKPVPLTPATQLHQGEPLFIMLTDKDQNLNAAVAETVIVSISNTASGDLEVIRLTETGLDSGVFIGYLPSTGNLMTKYNGSMTANAGQMITTRYIDTQDSNDTSLANLMVDPCGIMFDTNSGLPVNGATITMINKATGLPAVVFGDDGISSFPATITSGGSASDSSGRTYSFQPGGYRFPFVQPGNYQFRIAPPTGYSSPSSVASATIQSLPGAPFTIITGSRGEAFIINPGPSLRIDIPLDPFAAPLWMQKTSGKESAGQGDFIPYQLTVTNGKGSTSAGGVRVTDVLPLGFRFRNGSVRLNGLPAPDPLVSPDGQTLTFKAGSLASGAVAIIDYVVEVTAGARLGAMVNTAYAISAAGGRSNNAYATVTIRDDFLRTRSTLMGRVTTGACNEDTGEGPNGVEAVRIYLEDGSFVISDKRGMFHFEGVQAGLHVVQMDLDSLPKGYEAYACTENSRFAGRVFSQFVETQGGTLWRTDFHLRSKKMPDPDPERTEAYTAAKSQETVTTLPSADSPKVAAQKESTGTISSSDGILFPAEGGILLNRVQSIRIRLGSKLTPRLIVDNREVTADRIGFTMKNESSGTTDYSYIGVDLGERGNHSVQLQGIDTFSNVRFTQTLSVKRSGDIASIQLKSTEGNIADGITPVRLRLELFDADGVAIPGSTQIELRGGTLLPPRDQEGNSTLDDKVTSRWVTIDRDGWVSFQPVTTSGSYRVVLAFNSIIIEAETYVQPKLRDWILVGLAEGTAGYNTVSGNMEALQGTELAEDFQKDGRIAFFAKGQIQGKWLLTMSYDTNKTRTNSGNGLFQTINPDTYYTLYGDATQQQYDAASSKKLYIKIEREQFYAMFGDFDTGLTVTELSRYSRRMTGIKTELQTRNFEVNAFGSETEQVYMRDQIPGDGTSGVYRLSRRNIVPNSEKITIEVRDRFRSEIVVSTRTLGRFTEYSIDFNTGAVIFKEPIHSRDEHFNPITIIAEYEVVSVGGQKYTYGGRAGIKLLDQRLKVGATYIREDQGVIKSNLYGVDASFKLNQSTRLRVEFATSDVAAGTFKQSANAYLAEVSHTSKMFDARAYIREQETGFGLGQQSGTEAGTRKIGLESAYRFNDRFSTNWLIYRQYNLQNNATRDVGEAKLNYTDKSYSSSLGVIGAEDHLDDDSKHRSTQLTFGGKALTLYDRLTLTLDHAQSIISNSNQDFPTRTVLGAEFMVTRNLTLLAAQELTWGKGTITQNTRLGMRTSPWLGGTLSSSIERQFNENDERVFANVGLKQNWQISEAWKVDAGLDRSQTLYRVGSYQFDRKVSPASGGSENFTAISTGANYQINHLTWDNRLEFRWAGSENKWGLMSGVVNEVDSRWAWSGRAQVYQTSVSTGVDTTRVNLRFGLVFRPPQTKWIVLNRLDYLYDRQSTGINADLSSRRLINNLIANYRPRKDVQISMQYGAKYILEDINSSTYNGFTDHIGFEGRYDITKAWDIGMRGSLLHSWHDGQYQYSCGPSTGYNIYENAWVSVGYNIFGFEDKDFSSAAYTTQGPYVRFRMKFDQQSVKDAAAWLNIQ